MKSLKKKRGFTLIELLVVIAIIGTLATIVMVSLNTARSKARDTRRAADLKSIALALEMYYDANNNVYPATGSLSALVTGNFLATLPTDPKTTTQNYAYAACASNSDYTLGTQLENNNATILANGVVAATCPLTGQTPADCAKASFRYCIEP